MSGRITYMPEPLHPCDPPNPVGLPPMSVWECDCGDDWLLIPPPQGGHPSPTWWSRNPGIPEAKPGAPAGDLIDGEEVVSVELVCSRCALEETG